MFKEWLNKLAPQRIAADPSREELRRGALETLPWDEVPATLQQLVVVVRLFGIVLTPFRFKKDGQCLTMGPRGRIVCLHKSHYDAVGMLEREWDPTQMLVIYRHDNGGVQVWSECVMDVTNEQHVAQAMVYIGAAEERK